VSQDFLLLVFFMNQFHPSQRHQWQFATGIDGRCQWHLANNGNNISVTRFSTSGFFHESVSSKHLRIPLQPFQIFSKIGGRYTFAAQGAPPLSLTTVANAKNL
jgi:hypothetical protein